MSDRSGISFGSCPDRLRFFIYVYLSILCRVEEFCKFMRNDFVSVLSVFWQLREVMLEKVHVHEMFLFRGDRMWPSPSHKVVHEILKDMPLYRPTVELLFFAARGSWPRLYSHKDLFRILRAQGFATCDARKRDGSPIRAAKLQNPLF